MVAISSFSGIPKYSSEIISGISNLQRITISRSISQQLSQLSQENAPRMMAAQAATIINAYLTEANRTLINQFRSNTGAPYFLLRGLIDTEHLPATPCDDSSPAEQGWRLQAATMLGFLKLCGAQAASFQDEMGGRLFHMVMPAKNSAQSFSRSTKRLNFHTEVVNGYFAEENPYAGAPIAPDRFALACLRNPDNVRTTVLPLENILNLLQPKVITELFKPVYTARSQSSFDREIVIKNIPVLTVLQSGQIGMRYSNSKLEGTTGASLAALEELRLIVNSFGEDCSVNLQPGDMLILNNRLCLHGRGEVASTSRFDGSDRWLLRLYGYSEPALAKALFQPGSAHVMQVKDRVETPRRLMPV